MKDANATPNSPLEDFPIKISIENTTVLYKNTEQTLLECLEKEQHEIHYHCRDGYCGACRITLNSGKINYFKGEPLAYVGPNEILPCCCKPISDINITLI
ncbi:class I ribonucleotide reductase maintenance protein YfaE [Pseudocolwellia agarivorans]|uniref:class I ribonucleotide reductase maintenance protein YfaE n=1 Tax=Pseudocolwellia agarivorans TaxID=1911682 RepID=UPI000987CF25|nr:class I ribonucleotide reductase maintenance protein YfaE [Pseudocolwellia agarivorans]